MDGPVERVVALNQPLPNYSSWRMNSVAKRQNTTQRNQVQTLKHMLKLAKCRAAKLATPQDVRNPERRLDQRGDWEYQCEQCARWFPAAKFKKYNRPRKPLLLDKL